MKTLLILIFTFSLFLAGCAPRVKDTPQVGVINMQIIDRNGFSETISSKDRLATYEKIDFATPQPYKKVLRVYSRDENGKSTSKITSYHDNGQLSQYLEVADGRAHGLYREWHPNGKLAIETQVIEGLPDINDISKASWVFNGKSQVWNENGNLMAEIFYDQGSLESSSNYYHPNGQIWKFIPYHHNEIEGSFIEHDEEGRLIQKCLYSKGKRNGLSEGFWTNGTVSFQEEYTDGLLQNGSYYSPENELIAKVEHGKGSVAQFQDGKLYSISEYKAGMPEGHVKIYAPNEELISTYFIKNGAKNGEELQYYSISITDGKLQPKLSLYWQDDNLQGVVKTWYENGTLESQREMDKNKRQGLSFAWYPGGSLMLMEVYEHDKLVKGSYFEKGDKHPISKVEDGKGIASLFNSQGHFLKKITYDKGKPVLD